MFTHILLPTDGTEFSKVAVRAGVQLARALRAKVTGFYAAEEYRVPPFGEYVPPDLVAPEEFHNNEQQRAKKILAEVKAIANEADVACDILFQSSFSPWSAIVEVAESKNCDLIFMASHGRRGIASLLVGSETNRVLTHTKIPVLVYRS